MSLQQELQNNQKECFEQGKKEGMMIAKRRAIYGMCGKGLLLEDIADIIELTIEEVDEIISPDSNDSDENTVVEQKEDNTTNRSFNALEQELQKSQKEYYEQGKKEGMMIAKSHAIYGMYSKGLLFSDIADIIELTIEEVDVILTNPSSIF